MNGRGTAVVVLSVGLASLACGSLERDYPVGDRELALIVTATEVAEARGLDVGAIDESVATVAHNGTPGHENVRYDYSVGGEQPLVVRHWIASKWRERAAVMESVMMKRLVPTRIPEGLVSRPADDLLDWGDDPVCARVEREVDGQVVGAWCVARKDTAVVVFEAWGAPFHEAGSVGALLADELAALDALLAR